MYKLTLFLIHVELKSSEHERTYHLQGIYYYVIVIIITERYYKISIKWKNMWCFIFPGLFYSIDFKFLRYAGFQTEKLILSFKFFF